MSAVTMSAEELAKMNVVEEITIPIIQGELDLQSNVAIKQESKELKVWHYWLWNFKTRDTKLEGFLRKNQRTQRKPLNFENWTNGEPQKLAKIKVFKVDCFILLLFLVLKLRLVAQNEWKKHSYIFFSTFS